MEVRGEEKKNFNSPLTIKFQQRPQPIKAGCTKVWKGRKGTNPL